MKRHPSYKGAAYTRVFQRLCSEQNVPPRGKKGAPENRVRQSMLPRIHFEAMRQLDRGVTE